MLKFAVGALFCAGAGLFTGGMLALNCVDPNDYTYIGFIAMLVGTFASLVLLAKWLDERERDGAQTTAEIPEASPY